MRKTAPAPIGLAAAWTVLLVLASAPAAPTTGAAQESRPLPGLGPSVPDCPVCELWDRHESVVRRARQEVGSLENGVLYFYHSDRPSVIEPLIRLAYERKELQEAFLAEPERCRDLGGACGHALIGDGSVRVEISTGAHGFFVILTSDRADIVAVLHEEASQAVRGALVRF